MLRPRCVCTVAIATESKITRERKRLRMVLSHDMIVVHEGATEKFQHVFKDG